MPNKKLIKPETPLDLAVSVRTDYLSGLSITNISENYKISQTKVQQILRSEDTSAKRLAEENIQLKFDKQTDAIQELTDAGLTYLKEAITHAQNSENPHLFMDKVSSAIEKMDRIARLNLNRATEIKQTNTTHTRFDVAETIRALDTKEKQEEFLRAQLNSHIQNNAGNKTYTQQPATAAS
jgi:hypothetical protein